MVNTAMPQTEKPIYSARVQTVGGRERGSARSSDGRLDINLSVPGGPGTGTNPEQLLAAGWSACLGGAITLVARRMSIALPADVGIDAEVDLNAGTDGYFFRARLAVSLPGLDRAVAQTLVDTAHRTCPYSRALHGNVGVTINLA